MPINFYQEFVQKYANDPEITNALDEVLETPESAQISLDKKTRDKLVNALEEFSETPQFELMARGIQLSLDQGFDQFIPSLHRNPGTTTSLPSLETLIAGLKRNRAIYRRLENAHNPERLITSLFVTARELPRVDYDMIHDSGFIALMMGSLYITGGGIRSGMEFGNAGAELARLILGEQFLNAYIAIHLPFENPSLFPGHAGMRTSQESFITRKMGVFYGSDYYTVAAGGYGTMDEMLSVLSQVLSGAMPAKPIILLETTTDGEFWPPVIRYLSHLVENGAIDPEMKNLILYARNGEEYAQAIAFIERSKREERDETGNFDERFTVTHPSQYRVFSEMVRHDWELIRDVFEPLDHKKTLSVFAPEGKYQADYAGDAATLLKSLDNPAFFEGANILIAGDGAFGEQARLAGKALQQGILLSVEQAVDPASKIPSQKHVGNARFYTDAFYKAAMMYHSSSAIFYPGGLHTQSALFELMTLLQTLQIPHYPLVLVGGEEKWGHFLGLVRSFRSYGTISQNDMEFDSETEKGIFKIVATTEEAVEFLKNREFTKRASAVEHKPHKPSTSPEEDHVKLYERELKKQGIDEDTAKEVSKRLVHRLNLSPEKALETAQELLVKKAGRSALNALTKNETEGRPSAYRRMLGGALAVAQPELLPKIGIGSENTFFPETAPFTGRLAQIATAAKLQQKSPTRAVRQLIGPVTAQHVNFPLHTGGMHPSGLPLPAFPHALMTPKIV